MRLLAVLVISLATVAAQADPAAGRLSGSYRFHGKSIVDAPPGEAKDSHLGLVLEGAAARDLFRRLTAKARPDICLDDGSMTKTQGGIRCTQLAGRAGWRCEFAIQLDTQAVVADGAC